MSKKLATLILLGISFSCFAQRPLPIEKLKPIIDSIQIESDLLYAYEVSSQTALLLSKKKKPVYRNYFTYRNNDSTFVLFLNDQRQCILEYLFLENYSSPKSTLTRLRNLNNQETKLLDLQENLSQKAEVLSKDSIKTKRNLELHTLLIPSSKKYHLYYLTATEQDSVYPAGNDFLFIFNQDKELTNQVYLPFQWYSLKKEDQSYDAKILGITFLLETEKGLLSLPAYICKFRIYSQNIGFSEFIAKWNRRLLSYNSSTNEVKIHLFDNEKRSPKYRK